MLGIHAETCIIHNIYTSFDQTNFSIIWIDFKRTSDLVYTAVHTYLKSNNRTVETSVGPSFLRRSSLETTPYTISVPIFKTIRYYTNDNNAVLLRVDGRSWQTLRS